MYGSYWKWGCSSWRHVSFRGCRNPHRLPSNTDPQILHQKLGDGESRAWRLRERCAEFQGRTGKEHHPKMTKTWGFLFFESSKPVWFFFKGPKVSQNYNCKVLVAIHNLGMVLVSKHEAIVNMWTRASLENKAKTCLAIICDLIVCHTQMYGIAERLQFLDCLTSGRRSNSIFYVLGEWVLPHPAATVTIRRLSCFFVGYAYKHSLPSVAGTGASRSITQTLVSYPWHNGSLKVNHEHIYFPCLDKSHAESVCTCNSKMVRQWLIGCLGWWFGFLGSLYERDCYESGTPRIPDHQFTKKNGILHWHRFLHVFPWEDGFGKPTHRRIIQERRPRPSVNWMVYLRRLFTVMLGWLVGSTI